MSAADPFIRELDTYAPDLRVLDHYLDHTAFYISKVKGVDFQIARDKIKAAITAKDSRIPTPINPTVRYFQRDSSTGDTSTEETPLTAYLADVRKNNYTLAPTFTCYLSSAERPSLLVDFVQQNKKERAAAKAIALQARAENNMDLYKSKNSEQENKKIYNNSLSGAFASDGSILKNPSAHSTLTSTTRTVTSISNSNNEKILAGNRYYVSVDVILENIAAICLTQDLEKVARTMELHQLHYPTVEQTMAVVMRSAKHYVFRADHNSQIVSLVKNLSPVERAAFCYTSDLYHIRELNPEFTRKMLHSLMYPRAGIELPDIDYVATLSKLDETIINFVHQLHTSKLKGVGKKYQELDLATQQQLYLSYQNTLLFFQEYHELIETFFASDVMPHSVSEMPHMVREVVTVSDTDSTMFAVDGWVKWYVGDIVFTEESRAVAAAVGLLTTQTIRHLLAVLSAHMNVDRSYATVLAMKPEFVFPVFAVTSVAKHYYASIAIKEGNVFSETDIEIKGVHLKNSALPQGVIEEAKRMMKEILDSVEETGKVAVLPYLGKLYEKEKEIFESIRAGKPEYLRNVTIKDKEAYSDGAPYSPYQHYELWTYHFTKHLNGFVPITPYRAVRLPLALDSKTRLKAWIAGIEDRMLAADVQRWVDENNKSSLGSLCIPTDYIEQAGIPDFIFPALDHRRVIFDNTLAYRLILSSLGIFIPENYLLSEWMLSGKISI